MTEQWKPVVGYEGRYEVSNMGYVRSVDREDYGCGYKRVFKGKVLKPILCNGYPRVHIKDQSKNVFLYVHRLVADAFVSGYFDGAEVNHIDENRMNSRADNLEWVSHADNINHGTRNARVQEKQVKRKGVAVVQYTKEGGYVATYPSYMAAARAVGSWRQNITRAVREGGCVNGYLFAKGTFT